MPSLRTNSLTHTSRHALTPSLRGSHEDRTTRLRCAEGLVAVLPLVGQIIQYLEYSFVVPPLILPPQNFLPPPGYCQQDSPAGVFCWWLKEGNATRGLIPAADVDSPWKYGCFNWLRPLCLSGGRLRRGGEGRGSGEAEAMKKGRKTLPLHQKHQ